MINRRYWLLGAPDPEMERIERLLHVAGEEVRYACYPPGERVQAGDAYRAAHPGLADEDAILFVECDVPGVEPAARIDHHRKGDYGYGQPPERFLDASSLGQVFRRIHDGPDEVVMPVLCPPGTPAGAVLDRGDPCPEHGDRCSLAHPSSVVTAAPLSGWTLRGERYTGFGDERIPWGIGVPEDYVLAAAADHCLAAAYRGECPGVDPDALLRWRAETRAAHQGRPVREIERDVEIALAHLRHALRITLGGVEVADLREEGHIRELPEAAARYGIPFLARLRDRDGRVKVVLQAAPAAAIEEFLAGALGLKDMYGDPARGFAGGYEEVV